MSKAYPFPKSGWSGTNIGYTTLIKTGAGTLGKVIVNSHTSGTFKIFNGTNNGATAIGGTYTPASGSSIQLFEVEFANLFVQVYGTIDATILYE